MAEKIDSTPARPVPESCSPAARRSAATLVTLVRKVWPGMSTILRQWWLGVSRRVDGSARRPHDRVPTGPVHRACEAVLETPAPVDEPAAIGGPWHSDAAVVRDFTARLFGATALRAEPPTAAERNVLGRLGAAARAGAEEPLVPRLPSVLPKLMSLIRRDDMAGRELAELLGREPALLGEVMRIANSPCYRGTQALTSLDAAVAMLGQRGIYEVVSRAAMAPVFDLRQGRIGAGAGTLLWDQAQACAHACAFLRAGASDPFEAYLAGMVANAGLIVALRLVDQRQAFAASASLGFHDQLAVLSARLSARIARNWCFSEEVALAVESLAQPPSVPAAPGLAAAVRVADRTSKAHVLARSGRDPCDAPTGSDGGCRDELDRAFGRPFATKGVAAGRVNSHSHGQSASLAKPS